MDILHYKVLRVAVKDWNRTLPNSALDLLGTAKPEVLASYSMGSVFLTSVLSGKPTRLLNMMMSNALTVRQSGRLRFYDASVHRIRKQAIRNVIDDTNKHFQLEWMNLKTKDAVRIFLK